MKLSKLAHLTQGQFQGDDHQIQAVNTDSRSLKPGDLFFALSGPNFDGHDYVAQAAEQGALAAVVSHPIDLDLPQIVVTDPLKALGQFAQHHRQQFSLPIVAITGSCGKTTTKAMIASILNQAGTTLASEGSYNNAIGVPLTLLKLNADHQYAVCECGTNNPGEIAHLTHLIQPTVAVITNAAAVHLEGLTDIAGVATEKGSIFQGLDAEGIAILNADDDFYSYWREHSLQNQKVLTFGLDTKADITAKDIQFNDASLSRFNLCTPVGNAAVQLKVIGRHNIANACAAAAAAIALQIPLNAIVSGLQNMQAVPKRMIKRPGYCQATIIDDSYNANPESLRAAIDVLAMSSGKKILVLGNMGELGENAEQLHREIAQYAREQEVTQLIAFGDIAASAANEFGTAAKHYMDRQQLIEDLKKQMDANTTVLIKGSKVNHMWEITEAVLAT